MWPGKTRRRCRAVRELLFREYHGPPSLLLPNLLVRADNRLLLSSLLNGPLRRALDASGGIRLAYMDPPFAVGADFCMSVEPRGALSAVAYSDIWPDGLAGFLNMMHERLLILRDLLAPDGSLFLHCDHRTAPHLRLLLDEVFGPERFLGDIVWHYTGGGRAKRWFSRKHDRILHYARSASWVFNQDAVRVPYKPSSGYAKGGITSRAGKRYMPDPRGTPVDDVWDIPIINPLSGERCGYPTQKPESLLERIILAASNPGDLVADFFCGSGTTVAVAERLGRRWLACDNAALAVQATAKRLAAQPCAAPFVLASLEDERKKKSIHRARLKGKDIIYDLSDIRITVRRGEKGISLTLESVKATVQNVSVSASVCRQTRKAQLCTMGLDSFGPAPEDKANLTKYRDKPRHYQWLDGWSIGLAPGPDLVHPGCRAGFLYNRVLWQSRRGPGPGSGEAISLTSPELALTGEATYTECIVTLSDIFGNETRLAVPLSV